MDVEPGDEIVVDSMHDGQPRREGEIVEVETKRGVARYRVRWDDGHESTFFPGSTTHVVKFDRQTEVRPSRATPR